MESVTDGNVNFSMKNFVDFVKVVDHVTIAWGVFMLILCLIGIYGNVMSLIIFTRKTMRSSINVFLASLSVLDMFLLFMCIPVFVTPVLLDYFGAICPKFEAINYLCFYPLTLTVQTCSVWTMIAISLERYMAVCRPFLVKKYLTIRRAKCVQIVVIILSVLYNLIRFWEYRLRAHGNLSPAAGAKLYEIGLRSNTLYLSVYNTALYLMTHFLIPFMIIMILNFCVVTTMKRAQQERIRLSTQQVHQHKTSRMIIIVTVIFAMSNTLTFVLNIWEATNPNLFESFRWSRTAYILLDASNVCVVINSAVNFFIYLIYCRRYRTLFVQYNERVLLHFCRKSEPNPTNPVGEIIAKDIDSYQPSSIRKDFL